MNANVKHAPATPLPWEAYRTAEPMRNAIMQGGHVFAEIHGSDFRRDHGDSGYIAHAANAYPKLVEALRRFTDIDSTVDHMFCGSAGHDARALLRELGEAA